MCTSIESLFISDIHLGNSNCQADKLLKIFKQYDFKNLFIVGDFIDMTSLKRKFYWNSDQSAVIQKVLKYSRKKVNVVYIVGNHDYYIRELIKEGNIKIGDILICDEYIYKSISGENIFMTHGDSFDGFVRVSPFLYWLGDKSYEFSIKINKIYNFFRKLFGLEYWSLSSYLKRKVKNVIKFLSDYKKMSEIKVKEMKCDSIMIGHIHEPLIINKTNDSSGYYNPGDFLESCSYIIEDLDGNLKLKFC